MHQRILAGVTLALLTCGVSRAATYVIETVDFPGSPTAQIWGINNTGAALANDDSSSYIYQGGVFTPLPAPPSEYSQLYGLGINDAGVIVGIADGPDAADVGFVLTGSDYNFVREPGWANTHMRAVGPSGLVTGISYSDFLGEPGSSVGFLYDLATDSFTDLSIPGDSGAITFAQGINQAGQIVGDFRDGDFKRYAFVYTDGTYVTFQIDGASTAARGINDAGMITGFHDTPSGRRAFVGKLIDGVLVPEEIAGLDIPGAIEVAPQSINNLGQIAGFYTDMSNTSHGFIATPIPLPAVGWLLGPAFGVLGVMRRRAAA